MKHGQYKRSKKRVEEGGDDNHDYKIRKSNDHRKMSRNIDNVLKRKDFRQLLSNMDIDNY